jgi:hypothetical protein
MPRSSSNSRSNSSSSSSRPSMPPPKLWHQAPPMSYTSRPAPVSTPTPQAAQPSFGQIVKEGVGFGAGAEIGRTAIQSAFGLFRSSSQSMPPPPPQSPSVQIPEIPSYASDSYRACLETTKNDVTTCRPFLSKERSPWTQCMEMNFYQKEYCTAPTPLT